MSVAYWLLWVSVDEFWIFLCCMMHKTLYYKQDFGFIFPEVSQQYWGSSSPVAL